MMTDYEQLAPRYDDARAVPLETLRPWRDALAPLLNTARPVLDVGAGTGLWSMAFVRWFGASVVGVEPSQAMQRRAVKKHAHPNIGYVAARAERLPVRDDACGSAWLSAVVHHISDLPACAAELRRVLGPDGNVLIRQAFSDRAGEVPWLRWFPHARPAALRRWPTVAAVAAAFATARFAVQGLHRIRHVAAPNLAAYARTVRVRADSTLAAISDDDFERGMAALDRTAAEGRHAGPVITGLDLLMLR
jgi:ubiquinone/menaquinone biosynthesis C-methylase UbiE